MAKTLVDVDEEVLQRAQEALGTTTKKDTINQALAEVVAEREQRAALRREVARGRSGYYKALLDADIRR